MSLRERRQRQRAEPGRLGMLEPAGAGVIRADQPAEERVGAWRWWLNPACAGSSTGPAASTTLPLPTGRVSNVGPSEALDRVAPGCRTRLSNSTAVVPSAASPAGRMRLNRAGSNSSSNCITARFPGMSENSIWSTLMCPQPPLLLIHDLDVRGLALEAAHVPHGGLELLVVLARGRAHHLAVHHQPDLRVGVMPAADEEPDEPALDGERLADEPARRVIAAHDSC